MARRGAGRRPGALKPGQAARVTPAGGAPVAGRVRMVAPTVDAATRNGLVYVDLPRPRRLKAGMFARGEFELGSGSGLTLPQSAVLLRDGFSYVFPVGADNKVRQQQGRRSAAASATASSCPAACAANARVVASRRRLPGRRRHRARGRGAEVTARP